MQYAEGTDEALTRTCSTCRSPAGSWCRNPRGENTLILHASRYKS